MQLLFAFPSFKNLVHRFKRYLLLNDGYNYTNPVKLLSMYNRLEQSKAQDSDASGARINSILVLEDNQQQRFSVVLRKPADAKPENMEISVFSPLGAALLGAEESRTYSVSVHGSTHHFHVVQIIH